MDNQTIFAIIGYIASIILAISLLMKSLIRLRVLNGIGALIYVIYGILIEAYPVAVLNGIIFFIDLYFLVQMLQRRDYFTLMAVEPESAYLNHFIRFHNLDIQKFFPNFNYQAQPSDLIYFVSVIFFMLFSSHVRMLFLLFPRKHPYYHPNAGYNHLPLSPADCRYARVYTIRQAKFGNQIFLLLHKMLYPLQTTSRA